MALSEKQTLQDYPEEEKTAYLAAVASMATPEDTATPEEEEFLADLCDEAGLTEADKQAVIDEAKSPTNDGFKQYMSSLKNSGLKYPFIVDVISFAKADGHYSKEEEQRILQMARQLDVNEEQYQALYEYVDQAEKFQQSAGASDASQPLGAMSGGSRSSDPTEPEFLQNTGLKQKFDQLGIPVKQLLTGLIGPMLLRGLMGRRSRSGGLLGSLLGGGRSRGGSLGGLASVIGMLSGKRGYGRSGGLLGKLLK